MFRTHVRPMIIHLDHDSHHGSSHLPAISPSRIIDCLFSVAPRRDCPFHPTRSRLVSVALIRTLRQAAVSCYGALWSPDFPREHKGSRDHRGELYPSRDCTKFRVISPLKRRRASQIVTFPLNRVFKRTLSQNCLIFQRKTINYQCFENG